MDDTSAPPSKRLKTAEEENNDGTDDDAAIEATVVVDTTTALTIMTEKLIALAENQEKLLAENAELVSQVNALTAGPGHGKPNVVDG
jgi:predicted ATP-grasp superfamily ATP-dependent carboligase